MVFSVVLVPMMVLLACARPMGGPPEDQQCLKEKKEMFLGKFDCIEYHGLTCQRACTGNPGSAEECVQECLQTFPGPGASCESGATYCAQQACADAPDLRKPRFC